MQLGEVIRKHRKDRNMTQEEGAMRLEADAMLKAKSYQECFEWANEIIEQYPNCEQLIWQLAMIFDAQCMIQKIPNKDKYEEYLLSLYLRALESREEELARCFEMGRYYEVSSRLELATIEKDVEVVHATMVEMLSSVENIGSFRESSLYEHMKFTEPRKEFVLELKQNLMKSFQDEETFGFLKSNGITAR